MKLTKLVELQQRLVRQMGLLASHAGTGVDYAVEISVDESCRYVLPGIASHHEFQDRVENAVHWVAVLKDHIRDEFESRGGLSAVVEEYINSSRSLSLCIDLDNTSKHVRLTRPSRTGLQPQYGLCQISSGDLLQNGNLRALTRGVGIVSIEFAHPELVEYRLPILDAQGNQIAEAGEMLSGAVNAWELLLEFVGILSPQR